MHRSLVRIVALLFAGLLMATCTAGTPQVVEKTVEVTREVTRVVQEVVEVPVAPAAPVGEAGLVAATPTPYIHPTPAPFPEALAEKGVGDFAEFWKPIPMDRYWDPVDFYAPPTTIQGTFTKEECVNCHTGVTPGIVTGWSQGGHANLDNLLPYQQEKRKEIEARLGRSLDKVWCVDCHGDVGAEKWDHNQLRLPDPTVCGECHVKEFTEFQSEKEFTTPGWPEGRPSHALSWEAGVTTDVFAAAAGISPPHAAMLQGCQACHSIQNKCDSCHTRHKFSVQEARRPDACYTCHSGSDHPDDVLYLTSKHGTIYKTEGSTWDWSKPLKEANYPAPTCQYCHMEYKGEYSHNLVRKVVMAEGDVIFYSNVLEGVRPKEYLGQPEMVERVQAWKGTCQRCHSPRFVEAYFGLKYDVFEYIFDKVTDGYQLLQDLYQEKALYPDPDTRGAPPPPVAYSVPESLGSFYGEFWWAPGNPSRIEKDFLYLWENAAFRMAKGAAHVSPGAFSYDEHNLLMRYYTDMFSEANTLRRLKALEDAVGGR